jgi:hypothetical protein
MSAHFALRSAAPSEAEIRQVVDDHSLLISSVLVGDRPDFARDSYLLLAQGVQTIKPVKVRFVVASFNYADLDPKAKTKISVFPAAGGEVAFEVDFALIE